MLFEYLRHHRAAADVLIDNDGFAGFVVDEVEFGCLDDDGFAVADFVFRLDAGADDLLGRNALGFLGEDAKEVDAASGNDGFLRCGVVLRRQWVGEGGGDEGET